LLSCEGVPAPSNWADDVQIDEDVARGSQVDEDEGETRNGRMQQSERAIEGGVGLCAEEWAVN